MILNSGEKFILLRIANVERDWASCFHARNEIGRVFLPQIANMLFVSITFFAGKGSCESVRPFVDSSGCAKFDLKFAYVGWNLIREQFSER